MMNNLYFQLDGDKTDSVRLVPKISRIMKLTLFLVCLSVSMSFAAMTNAQDASLSLKVVDQSIKEVLAEIESRTDLHFFYNSKLVDVNQLISVDIKDQDVYAALEHVFKGSSIGYKVVGKDVILSVKKAEQVSAQDKKTITGTVVDEKGEPVIGANVVEKGTTNGTITDIDGKFTMDVNENAILMVSYIGFNAQDVKVGANLDLAIALKEDTQALEEVVVVGYGTQKKVNLTGAINVISDKEFANRQASTVSQLLQGAAPGFNFDIGTQDGFEPGATMNISIRGMGSLNGGSPYVVIDGFPGDLNNLNPDDIESISVLKDAAASAIYGARAPYGVILVTTKKGKKNEKVSVSYTGNLIVKTAQKLPESLDSYTWTRILNEAGDNRGGIRLAMRQ